MINYSDCLKEHFYHPRGLIKTIPSRAMISAAGGEDQGVIFNLIYDNNQYYIKVHGCPYMVACASYACECLNNHENITADILIEKLEIPQHKAHCAILVERVILNLKNKQLNRQAT